MNIIPISASAGISGFESPAAEYHQLARSLDDIPIEHPSSTFIGKAAGDSMEGVGIFDGDLLIVDRHVTAKQNDVIVANLNGEFVCKLLDVRQRMLVSANPIIQPVLINDLDSFSVEGVCHRPSYLFGDN